MHEQGIESIEFKGLNLKQLEDEFFIKLRIDGKSINTLKNYKTDLECFNQYLLKEQTRMHIESFSIDEVQHYGDFLQNKYQSDNSRRRRVQALRIFFDYLVEKQVFPNNPVRKIPTSPKFLDIPRPTAFAHVKTLWSYLEKETESTSGLQELLHRRNQLLFIFIYGAGLKVSDVVGLKVGDILLGATPRVMINHHKRDPYTVPLPPTFEHYYNQYVALLAQWKEKSKIDFDSVLFNANPYRILSGGLSARGIEIIFEEFRKKLLIEVTPKSLRQACIFKWLSLRLEDTLIKEWLGVAPSYSLKLYKQHMENHFYTDDFLNDLDFKLQ